MKKRLKKAMILVLATQIILFGLAIFNGNAIKDLSDEYLTILDSYVLLRKNSLEDEMLQYWSNIAEFENYLQKEVETLGIREDESLIPELLESLVQQAVVTLRQNGVTETFVILETEKGHEGFHLRDLDPTFNDINNSDILMERGSIEIAKKIGVPLDSHWAKKFDLVENEKESDFYFKPFQAAQSYPDLEIEDLGYWSRPFKLSPEDIEIVTYSIPLIDKEGSPYGVIGVGVTADYLAGKLKYDELIEDKKGVYLLSINDDTRETSHKIVSSGPMYNMLVGSQADFEGKEGYENIYKVKRDNNLTGEVYASEQFIDLYNPSTPFANERWSLTGIVEENDLFRPIRGITISILISLVISLLFGVVVVYIAGNWFMKPIDKLMQSVLASNPQTPFQPIQTNISEIDELGLAMETLNEEILDSASKVSRIINMVNVPIGAFEYSENEAKAFCTDTVFEILGIENKNTKEVDYVKASYLKEVINKIKKQPLEDKANVYRYEKDNGSICWIQMIIQKKKSKVLGVIEDVSDEILLQRQIEYERDHDVLTHLLNRRAFEKRVREKISDGLDGYAAFVMWDLDNLKYINDTYGHEYGDEYIKKAASALSKSTIYNSIVARISGDEFYTFIYSYPKKEDITKIVDEIKENLYNEFLDVPDGELIRIRASVGIAWYPEDSSCYEELMRYSDFAMYEVKNSDKGSILEFCKKTYNKNSILLHGKEELNNFIDDGLVKYAFQPIVDARTGEIFAYEALMRPQSEYLKSPYDVLRLARSQSKLYEIEKLTLFGAMEAFERQKHSFGDAKVFINSIPNYVLTREDLKLFEQRYSNSLDRIVIEITENEQGNDECTRIKKKTSENWGSQLALDDFGSGYSGELSLLILSPKYVKIDMDIVRGIDKDKNRQKLLKNILSYAENRGIKIIPEGVETREEMEKLIEFGVDYMQGYYLGKPSIEIQALDPKIKSQIETIYKRAVNSNL